MLKLHLRNTGELTPSFFSNPCQTQQHKHISTKKTFETLNPLELENFLEGYFGHQLKKKKNKDKSHGVLGPAKSYTTK